MHALLVTTFERGRAKAAHSAAQSTFGAPLVTNIVEGAGLWSFAAFCPPAMGVAGQRQRKRMKDWLEKASYGDGTSPYDWVEVPYGTLT